MRCHVCNVAVGDGQRFCHECGESLDGVTDPTEALDVIPDGANALGVDAANDDVTVETRGTDDAATGDDAGADDAGAALQEPEPGGDLPDLAAPPMGEDNDASWWAAGGGAPEPVDALPGTEPMDVIAASPPIREEALAATEAMTVTSDQSDGGANALDSVPYEPVDQASVVDPVAIHEPTTTMPATAASASAAPVASALGVTDEFAPRGSGDVGSTSQMAVTEPGGLFDGAADAHEHARDSDGFRLRAALVFGLLATVATLMASIADVIDIRTTRPVDGIIVGIRTLDDFGSNLAVAGFVGAGLMLIGGLLSCFGLRWGAGVAGGAGLSMTGWAAVTLGLVEAPIHAAEGRTLDANEVTAFTLSITRDLGYFLILAIGILGLVAFVVSLRMAGTGGRSGLNPWIAAVGALSAVVLAAGPLITPGGVPLDANLGTATFPVEFHAGRLIQLGLIVVTGVVGFLSVRTYGLGLAAGGLSVATWMWITSLAEFGALPQSVGAFNIGSADTMPHAVTTVGVTASLALLLIAVTLAAVTRPRRA
ncbi:MAG: hypothetical protein WA964_14240 [Ilumatobacter sp.]|uniref:hypothetical protein n=1 Tax=Ilumatobacter sp. TaxID=1967498 RepID=UPI003C7843AA